MDSADVCYDDVRYTGWHTGYPDAQVRLDLGTQRNVPWDGDVPFFLGAFVKEDGETPLEICPRQLLKTVVKRAQDMGLTPACGMEFEWFNFRETPQSWRDKGYIRPEPITPGMFGYSILRAGQNRPFMNALMDELASFGVPIEGLHTETGPGVFEAALLYSDAVEAGDRAVLFKTSAKEIGEGPLRDHAGAFRGQVEREAAGLLQGHIHHVASGTRITGRTCSTTRAGPRQMSDSLPSTSRDRWALLPEIPARCSRPP